MCPLPDGLSPLHRRREEEERKRERERREERERERRAMRQQEFLSEQWKNCLL